jgi:RNA polymerase sigma factor (sigma-70 family)
MMMAMKVRRGADPPRVEELGTRRLAAAPEDPLAVLHRDNYDGLVRLAAVVLGDVGLAEQVVQDAFVRIATRWRGLRGLDNPAAYLRSSVMNGCRSLLRHQRVRDRHDARRTVAPSLDGPEPAALAGDRQHRVVAALRLLPLRQREALVLRFYLDLPEAEIAAAMAVSPGSVKTHLHRGLAGLARLLEDDR